MTTLFDLIIIVLAITLLILLYACLVNFVIYIHSLIDAKILLSNIENEEEKDKFIESFSKNTEYHYNIMENNKIKYEYDGIDLRHSLSSDEKYKSENNAPKAFLYAFFYYFCIFNYILHAFNYILFIKKMQKF